MLPQLIQNRVTTRADGTKEIHIKRRNGERYAALVDAADFHRVERYRWWSVLVGRCARNYVATQTPHPDSRRLLLHRVVLGDDCPDDKEVAFINGDPHDCRRHNLLVTNHAEVMVSINTPSRSNTGHRGIWWSGYTYRAVLHIRGKVYANCFPHLRDAIRWRDEILKECGVKMDRQGRRHPLETGKQ